MLSKHYGYIYIVHTYLHLFTKNFFFQNLEHCGDTLYVTGNCLLIVIFLKQFPNLYYFYVLHVAISFGTPNEPSR